MTVTTGKRTSPATIAVVLAGAVAKGAFEAGVIQALARAHVDIVRIVGSSSGALNGTMLASMVRTGQLVAGADQLAALWRDHAEWNEVFHASVRDILRRDGFSDQKRLLALLRAYITPSRPPSPHPIDLRLIVSTLRGRSGEIGERTATTFEAKRDFAGDDFASSSRLDQVFAAAVASAAFPVVFAPVELDDLGPCVDGGTVNNTPVKWALGAPSGEDVVARTDGPSIDAIVVVATSVENRSDPPELNGFAPLVGHIADMLVEERLYRDLREAEQVNQALARLQALVPEGALTSTQLDDVMEALGWTGRRVVPVIPIRPRATLRGNAFAAFASAELRREYLELGRARGAEVLGGLGWL